MKFRYRNFIEIQRTNQGAGKLRARFNSSLMDANLLQKGKSFDELPETYVVFITEQDVIGKGQPVYQVERCFLGTGEKFGDGSHILYVNGAYRGDTPIGRLMHDFSCADPSEMYYDVLAERTKFFKETMKGVSTMSSVAETLIYEIAEERAVKMAEEKAIKMAEEMAERITAQVTAKVNAETVKAFALRMLASGKFSLEDISEISGLSPEEIKQLQKSA